MSARKSGSKVNEEGAGLVMMVEQLLTLGTFVALLLVAQHRKLFRPAEDERRVAA